MASAATRSAEDWLVGVVVLGLLDDRFGGIGDLLSAASRPRQLGNARLWADFERQTAVTTGARVAQVFDVREVPILGRMWCTCEAVVGLLQF